MTKLLTRAFQKASRLPESLQNQFAREFLDELQWESRWDETLAKTPDKIDRLAEKAARQYKAGRTREMGFDEL